MPDFTAIILEETMASFAGSMQKWKKYSVLFSEMLMTIQECDDSGEDVFYAAPEYCGCKVENDIVLMCVIDSGWLPAPDKIQELYRNKIADKELLGEEWKS